MTKPKNLTIALCIGTFLVSTVARSESYIAAEAGIGYGYSSLINAAIYDQYEIGATGRLSLGYLWNLTDRFKLGVEAGTQAFQNIEDQHGPVTVTAKRWDLDVLGVADYFVTERFDVFAKVGTAFVDQEYLARFNGNTHYNGEKFYIFLNDQAIDPQSRFVPKAVVGVGYNIQKNLNLNFSLNHEFRNDNHWLPGVASLLVGAKYSFS